MKRKLVAILTLCVMLALCVLGLSACGHTHTFDKQVTQEKYVSSIATCTEKAKYYYSCECGEKGELTFEHGSALEHEFTDYISDNNATYDNDGTKTATCNRDNCSATDTVIDDGTKLISHIEFKTLDLENKNIFANNVGEFSFLEEIETFGNSKFNVSSDKHGKEEYLSKIVPLESGDNTFYVFESIDGDIVNTYTVVLRRRPMYSVQFNTNGGSEIASQTIEESFTASIPTEKTERACYTFDGWDFDFATPITQDITVNAKWAANYYTVQVVRQNNKGTVSGAGSFANAQQVTVSATVNAGYTFVGWYNGDKQVSEEMVYKFNPTENVTLTAKWTANTDTKYTVEYYFEKLDGGYEIDNTLTEELTGTTDTTATVTPKTFEHFTFNNYKSNKSANIDGKGNAVLKLYYTRNYYTLSHSGAGSITNTGTYKYGAQAITSVASLGYDVVWKSGEEVLSTESEYIFTVTQDVVAVTSVKKEMQIFNFTSTTTTCEITGLKDKTKTSITIPNYVTSIGDRAFYKCTSLERIEILSSVTSIGDDAFYECPNLKSVTFGENSKLESIVASAFYNCTSLESIEIPSSVTIINNYAFYNCNNLKSVTFGENSKLESIGSSAFYKCRLLESIEIPTSVTSIGSSAFYGCSKLTIYCEAERMPDGWDIEWNPSNRPVVWGYKG